MLNVCCGLIIYNYLQYLPQTHISSYRALRVHQQQVFGKSIVHARQYIGPWVGSALTNQEVPVVFQQFFSVTAAHFAVVPRLALQLLLCPEGQ